MNWKTIENYPNYEVSDCGLVMNSKGNILKPEIAKQTRYKYINLCKNGKPKHCTVHRLVAQAFIPNPENKREVDHIDRCRTNNHVDNLRWVTKSENMANTKIFKTNKLGIQYISYDKSRNRYVFSKTTKGTHISKRFKTLDEAIQFKQTFSEDLGYHL